MVQVNHIYPYLEISRKLLEGQLNLQDFINLEYLNCFNAFITLRYIIKFHV
jgi:hypothetical protein